MNYVFFGTPKFAAIILEKLIVNKLVPRAIVTNPDRPTGRKKILRAPPVKEFLVSNKIPIKIFQPNDIIGIEEDLKKLMPDLFLVAAFAQILKKEILDIPEAGSIGVHPSLLPKYRGPTPIQTVILNGEKNTGITIYLMDQKVDHGPILATSHLPLGTGDNYESLLRKLAELAGDLLIETLPKFIKGEIKPSPQNDDSASYTRKFTSRDGFVDLKKDDPLSILKKIRALNPEPGIWTLQNHKRLKLLDADIINGKLIIKAVQKEGGKPQTFDRLSSYIDNFS